MVTNRTRTPEVRSPPERVRVLPIEVERFGHEHVHRRRPVRIAVEVQYLRAIFGDPEPTLRLVAELFGRDRISASKLARRMTGHCSPRHARAAAVAVALPSGNARSDA